MVGSGIYASPGPVLAYTKSIGMALVIWFVSGLLAITGSLCYAELGTMIPSSGGEHSYLLRAFGTVPAFLFSWSAIVCIKPASIAIISMIFGEYVREMFGGNRNDIMVKLIACGCIVIVTVMNATSTRVGMNVMSVLTILKIASLILFSIIGIYYLVISILIIP